MSLKYRIRLQNERVIGPFSDAEIGELYLKGHIHGNEECQLFPIGDWKNIQSFSELNILIRKIQEKNLRDEDDVGTSAGGPTRTNHQRPDKTRSNVKTFKEFKFGKDVKIDVDYEELEKKYREENPDLDHDDRLDKTVVLRKKIQKPKNIDKTVVVRPFIKKVDEPVPEPVVPTPEIVEEVLPPAPTEEELRNEKTEFINLTQVLPTINAQLSISEVELDKQAKIEENLERKRLKEIHEQILLEQAEEDGVDDVEVQIVEEYSKKTKDFVQRVVLKKKKKGMSIIVAVAFLAIFYVLLSPDEAPKNTGPVFLQVKFPITAEVENQSKANDFLVKGRQLYSTNTYLNKLAASENYLLSLQNKFSNNEALGEILITYSELLDNAKDFQQASNTLYKFVQLSESKLLTDLNVVIGVSLFYQKIQKYQTGIYIVKNYLRAGGKPSPKLLSHYLDLLILGGELVEARKVYDALEGIAKKPIEAYLALAHFDINDDQLAKARSIVENGIKYYPNSTPLLLQLADILFKEKSLEKYDDVLGKVKAQQAEFSPSYLSKYLEQMGFLSALNNKNKDASLYFKKSLELKESEELRGILSTLEISGDKSSQALILESKVIGLLKKAKSEHRRKNIESAFTFAIEAVDASPDYVPAIYFQAQLNMERGFLESAVYSLQRAISLNPNNNQLKKLLTEVYLKSYKYEDAERVLGEIAQTKFSYGHEYASLMGQLADAKKNPLMAIRWYNEALKRSPLNDADMYRLAEVLVRNKRFPEARDRLSKAIVLDPKNIRYLVLYSEILYEQDGTDTAVGYLRDLISELGEDPLLVSSIALIYFKSGQLKDFQVYYKKVQEQPKKDESFYLFLIAAAQLEERGDEFYKHSRDLLKLNPGNLKVRMDLGEYLIDQKKYEEARIEFLEIKERLESYPKVHYQLARVYMAQNNIEKAKEMAEKELKLNPNLDSAHFIMGEVSRLSKDYRDAIVKYEKAISLNPRSVDALMAFGWIRLNQNYANEAIELFSRALREDPTNPLIHKQMGDAYRAAGQRAMAREKYEDYLKLSPAASDKDMVDSLIKNLQ